MATRSRARRARASTTTPTTRFPASARVAPAARVGSGGTAPGTAPGTGAAVDQAPPGSRSATPTRNGSARLLRPPARTSRRPPANACTAGFQATVRGKLIKRVVFSLDGKRIGTRTKPAFRGLSACLRRHARHQGTRHVQGRDARQDAEVPLPRLRRPGAAAAPRPVAVHRMSHGSTSGPRPPGIRRGVAALAVALLRRRRRVLVLPAHAAAAQGPASEPLVVLLRDHVARTRPSVRAHRIEPVAARRPLTGVRTVLPVLAHATSGDGRAWVRVRLPGRPSGHTGWIPSPHTRAKTTSWRIAVRLSTRRVTVYRDGTSPAASGDHRHGLDADAAAAGSSSRRRSRCRRSTTAARSRWPPAPAPSVLQEFDGGPGPDRPPRHQRPVGRARHRGLARLHPPQHRRDHVAGAAHRQRRPAAHHPLAAAREAARAGSSCRSAGTLE